MSSTVTDRIVVDRPISTVYNQWTQFEDFPRFMEGVESVYQLDDRTLRWKASIAGVTREWDARIVDQEPDRRIAWETISGTVNRGVVTFAPVDAGRTEVALELELAGQDLLEKAGEKLGIINGQAAGDLRRFKDFIETRGTATGAWRGEIDDNGPII